MQHGSTRCRTWLERSTTERPYADSKSDGLSKAKDVLTEIAAKCSETKFTITGYSQGADIAGDLASEIGNSSGPVKAEQILAVGLLADPGAGTKGEAVIGPQPSGKGLPIRGHRVWGSCRGASRRSVIPKTSTARSRRDRAHCSDRWVHCSPRPRGLEVTAICAWPLLWHRISLMPTFRPRHRNRQPDQRTVEGPTARSISSRSSPAQQPGEHHQPSR